MSSGITNTARYEISFRSLYRDGGGLAFPCDERGRVDLDDLTDFVRNRYLYARALVGREFAAPSVQLRDVH